MAERETRWKNIQSLMAFTEVGMETVETEKQEAKAPTPILFTDVGMEMEVRDVQ